MKGMDRIVVTLCLLVVALRTAPSDSRRGAPDAGWMPARAVEYAEPGAGAFGPRPWSENLHHITSDPSFQPHAPELDLSAIYRTKP